MPLHKQTLQHLHNCVKQILLITLIICFSVSNAHAQMEVLRNLYERAVTAYNAHQYEQSMDLYQQMIKIVPGFAAAYNGWALANQADGGDEDKTISYLKTAVSYDPKMATAYDNLGRIYYTRQDMDQAQKYFEKALSVDPNMASAELTLAWIYLLVRSKPEMALKYFNKLLSVSQDPKIYYGIGLAYFSNNQRSEALAVITKLHEMGAEDLASQLEDSMRNTPQVDLGDDNNQAQQQSSGKGLGPLTPTEDKPTGMQVHLRGKLSDY
jgi:tetratricopeptide (TPR) repeat protein